MDKVPGHKTPLRRIDICVRHPALKIDRPQVRRLVHALDAAAPKFRGGCPSGALSLAFVTDRQLAQLHGDFLDDPTSTDVITFEGEPSLGQAGEICVCVDTARDYARRHRKDFSTELSLYLVHGWLHLAGYDDLRPPLKRSMRRAEARALNLLASSGLLSAFHLLSLSAHATSTEQA